MHPRDEKAAEHESSVELDVRAGNEDVDGYSGPAVHARALPLPLHGAHEERAWVSVSLLPTLALRTYPTNTQGQGKLE
jgi:hypothetical protein